MNPTTTPENQPSPMDLYKALNDEQRRHVMGWLLQTIHDEGQATRADLEQAVASALRVPGGAS